MDDYFNFTIIELNPDEISKIKKAWENYFVPIGANSETIHIDCMLWHIFSYEVKECQKGKQAINSFREVLKDKFNNLYIFYQRRDTGYMIDNNTRAFIYDDLNLFITDFETADIYVTDNGFNWTYVQTHEALLGPYFCKR